MIKLKEFDNLYGVTEDGRIYSFRAKRFLRPGIKQGYPITELCINMKRKRIYIHRLVALAYFGPSNLHVNHKDGNKENNHISNLEYCTQAENNRHAIATGLRTSNPEKIKGTKATWQIVNAIRSEFSNNVTYKKLANKYKLGITTVFDIVNNKTWIQRSNHG